MTPPKNRAITTDTATVGICVRRPVRRLLLSCTSYGVTFTEEKGLINSLFVITGPVWVLDFLHDIVTKETS